MDFFRVGEYFKFKKIFFSIRGLGGEKKGLKNFRERGGDPGGCFSEILGGKLDFGPKKKGGPKKFSGGGGGVGKKFKFFFLIKKKKQDWQIYQKKTEFFKKENILILIFCPH